MKLEPVKIRYHQGEAGWALPRAELGTFTIDNLPFDGGLVNFKDVVRCRVSKDKGLLDFVDRVEERVYHAWTAVKYAPETKARYTALRTTLEAKSCAVEGSFPGMLVVASNVEDVSELLLFLAGAGDGTVSVVDHRVLPSAPFDLPNLDPSYGAPAPTAGKPGPAVTR
jgi:hypothetical protein